MGGRLLREKPCFPQIANPQQVVDGEKTGNRGRRCAGRRVGEKRGKSLMMPALQQTRKDLQFLASATRRVGEEERTRLLDQRRTAFLCQIEKQLE